MALIRNVISMVVEVSNLGTDKPTKEKVLKQIRVIMNNVTDGGGS